MIDYSKNLSLESLFYINDEGLIYQEEWRDIPNYEGLYQVSDLGRIKSLSRKKKNGINSFHFIKELILKNILQGDGYYVVCLSKLGKIKTIKIHQLVAIAFLNHTPCGYELVINHKDFNKLNNYIKNLEIVTSRENSNRKHIKNTSEYIGVSWHKSSKKWASTIGIKKQTIYLGIFENEIDAHNAYQNALKNLT